MSFLWLLIGGLDCRCGGFVMGKPQKRDAFLYETMRLELRDVTSKLQPSSVCRMELLLSKLSFGRQNIV